MVLHGGLQLEVKTEQDFFFFFLRYLFQGGEVLIIFKDSQDTIYIFRLPQHGYTAIGNYRDISV